jgi:hypothetical protein
MAGWGTVAMHKIMAVEELPRRAEMQQSISLHPLLQNTATVYPEACYNIPSDTYRTEVR